MRILRTRDVLDPLPVLSPRAGLITSILTKGDKFREIEPLFELASDRYIEVELEKDFVDYLRPGKLI